MEISLVWVYFFAVLAIGMLLLVPYREIINLLPFGLGGGLVVAFIIQYLAIDVFNWWRFNVAWLEWAGIPLGILVAWVPPVIIFGYYFPRLKFNWGLVLVFALGSTIIEYLFVLAGYRDYLNWNIYFTFGLGLIIHLGLGAYLQYKRQLTN